ncbi:GPR1/FUN34/yaaH family-domain-containing protein [Xylariaceae sp. FL0255]|nr:GPR1/FUN34/yaaH family-domain-containing protein [Xylariaceae sp. FL0255]
MSSQVFTDRDLEKQSASTIAPVASMGHRKSRLASANPLGLLAFGQSLFMLSILGFHPRGVTATNIVVGNYIWMGGVAQFVAGIIDFCAGNAFGATVFCGYGAFNLAYATNFIPGSGILAAYSTPEGVPTDEFYQAIALFIWSWFIITFIFTVGASQANYTLFSLLSIADVTLILLATGFMMGSERLMMAGSGTGLVAAFISFYAAAAYLYVDGVTPFTLPLFPIRKDRIV